MEREQDQKSVRGNHFHSSLTKQALFGEGKDFSFFFLCLFLCYMIRISTDAQQTGKISDSFKAIQVIEI